MRRHGDDDGRDKVTQPARRRALKMLAGAGAGALAATGGSAPKLFAPARADSAAPLRFGFQLHRTGVGAAYGRWYDRAAQAAAKLINEQGGINGRPLQLIVEDDGTDPRRGAEVLEKFADLHRCDIAFGALFSHVVVASAPRAGELKMPYFPVSEGYHVASGALNRYVLQVGISDVRSQVRAIAPFVAGNLGRKAAMIFPDYAFGHDHRDYFTESFQQQGGQVTAKIAIPPTETSFTRYFPKIPRDVDVIYHVMVGPAVLTFVREMGRFFGARRPEIFGFIDSLEAVDLASPGLEFLEGSYFWEGHPRYAGPASTPYDAFYRRAVGVNDAGASLADPRDIAAYSHMFGCWETLFVIKRAMETVGYRGAKDRQALIEAVEAMRQFPASREHPQGPKLFNGRTHQLFAEQHISRVEGGRLRVLHTTAIEDSLYPDETDYTKRSF